MGGNSKFFFRWKFLVYTPNTAYCVVNVVYGGYKIWGVYYYDLFRNYFYIGQKFWEYEKGRFDL